MFINHAFRRIERAENAPRRDLAHPVQETATRRLTAFRVLSAFGSRRGAPAALRSSWLQEPLDDVTSYSAEHALEKDSAFVWLTFLACLPLKL